MPVEDVTLTVGEERISGRVNSPADPSGRGVVCLHGIAHGPYGGIFDRVAESATERGLQFLRYSSWQGWEDVGRRTLGDLHAEIDAAIEHLRSRGCTEISLLGKSFGGAIALTYAPGAAVRIALWAPAIPVRERSTVDDPDSTVISGPEDLAIDADRLAAVAVPVLLVHGDRDDVIPLENSRRIAARVPNGELIEIPGLDHSFEDEAVEDRIVDETLAFLTE